MRGYVVSVGGTFGIVQRTYISSTTGRAMAVVAWGPLGWVTPFDQSALVQLSSSYESEARLEADELLASIDWMGDIEDALAIERAIADGDI